MPDGLNWHKSSYSSAHGGNCVEVTGWHKSRHSGNQEGHCVELANFPRDIHVRDTQHRELGHLTFPASSWHAFISSLKAEEL